MIKKIRHNILLQVTLLIFFASSLLSIILFDLKINNTFVDNSIISLKPFFLLALFYLIIPLVTLLFLQTFGKNKKIEVIVYNKLFCFSFHSVALIISSILIAIFLGILLIEINKLFSLRYPLEIFAILYISCCIAIITIFKRKFGIDVLNPIY